MALRIAFVVPPKLKSGAFIEAEDCCWKAANKRILPAMLLACASQVEHPVFIDLTIDRVAVLEKAKPDVIAYPVIWRYYEDIMPRMAAIMRSTAHIILPVPPGYAGSLAGTQPPLAGGVPTPFCAVYSEPERVFADLTAQDMGGLREWRRTAKGLVWRDDAAGVGHKSEPLPTCLGDIKGTDYHLVPNHYWKHYGLVVYQVTRGCPYRCTFCVWGGSTVTDRTFAIRPAAQVAADLKQLRRLANKGRSQSTSNLEPIPLYVLSAQLTTSLPWIKEFHEQMKRGPYPFQSNVNLFEITPQKIELLVEAGMRHTSAGLEALSDKMLARIGKRHNFDQGIKGALILEHSKVKSYTLHVRSAYGEQPEDLVEALVNMRRMYDAGVRRARMNFGPLAHFRGTVMEENPPCLIEQDPRHTMPVKRCAGIPLGHWRKVVNLAREFGWVK